MYSIDQLKVIAAVKPHHTDIAAYARWRRAAVELGLPTRHEIVTPEHILEKNRRYRKSLKERMAKRSKKKKPRGLIPAVHGKKSVVIHC